MYQLTTPQAEALEFYALRQLGIGDAQSDTADYGATLNLIKQELISSDANMVTDDGMAALVAIGLPALAAAIGRANGASEIEPVYGEKIGRDMAGHMRRYQTRDGRTFNEHAAPCVEDCDACHGTGVYADESWYDDGMM